jgi:membrane protein DedA with SNARE-associated domain
VSAIDLLQSAGHSPFVLAVGLFLLPFIHEDVAIVAATLLLQDASVSSTVVVPSLFSGMVASDAAFYGLGVFAARLPWTQKVMARPGLDAVAGALEKRILETMLLVRLVPGLLLPCFMTFGARRFCFRSFLGASSIFSMIYLAVVLGIALFVCRHWPAAISDSRLMMVLAVPVSLAVVYAMRWAATLVAPRLVARASIPAAGRWDGAGIGQGLDPEIDRELDPALDRAAGRPLPPPAVASFPRPVAAAERIPPLVFYAPLAANWLRLALAYRSFSLPTAANPTITTGGMWGERKSEYLASAGPLARSFMAPTLVFTKPEGAGGRWGESAAAQCAAAGLSWPLVLKPDIGWQGYGVRAVADAADFGAALASLPAEVPFLAQAMSPYRGEAGLLYARLPGAPRGQVVSLAIRHHPAVMGNGRVTVAELIAADPRLSWKSACYLGRGAGHRGLPEALLRFVPAAGEIVTLTFIGSQRVGGFYRDGSSLITAALEARFDAIARDMAEFHYGRFDIRFDSPAALMRGEDFQIIEVNGIGGEAIHVWDPAFGLGHVYRELFRQQALLFEIGDRQRQRGVRPCGTVELVAALMRQSRLIGLYPASE